MRERERETQVGGGGRENNKAKEGGDRGEEVVVLRSAN
jgi:hypothetical protein